MSQTTAEEQRETRPVETPRKKKASKRPPSHRGFGWTLIHAFGSLKLAMLLFVVIIVASIFGTIEESRFDARVAQHNIYSSTWFTFWLIVLCINLAAAALTRWPWKKRHTGFVLTHTGIIILLIGSIIGKHFGIEGTMTLNVGEAPKNHLFLAEMAIQFGQPGTDQLYRTSFPVDLSPPNEKNPRYLPVPGYLNQSAGAPFTRLATRLFNRPPQEPTLIFDRFSDSLVEESTIVASPGSPAEAVRIELRSAMMGGQTTMVELISEPADQSFYSLGGLAQISLGSEIVRTFDAMESPTPLLQVSLIDDGRIEYHAINSRGEVNEGVLSVGEQFETGWADWTVTLLDVVPEARRDTSISESRSGMAERLTGVRGWLDWGDGRKTEPQWFVAGDSHRLRLEDEEIHFAFGYRREPLPFEVELINFEVPRDEGTQNPANFTSYLRFRDFKTGQVGEDSCGMNVPAVFPAGFHRLVTGLTYKFSQASWNPEDLSESTVQVLRDPGWFFKWTGSLVIVVGIYIIFFKRSYRMRRPEDIIDEMDVEELNAPSGKPSKQ